VFEAAELARVVAAAMPGASEPMAEEVAATLSVALGVAPAIAALATAPGAAAAVGAPAEVGAATVDETGAVARDVAAAAPQTPTGKGGAAGLPDAGT
jgi:hypothetical protein